ncbi:MAG TPA: protein-L-isoaspartate(D-aspartate) O-methyltransferase, partial [Myxococcota bacterium]|nr:protein-L-isoaspartate(D-aspartate) O-methyltransferase [Myxococcota bacterium]
GVKRIDSRVLDAMRAIDRRHFVRPRDVNLAYGDYPLDIGYGQTISQPFIVALVTHLIEPKPTDKVLEVGSGSGYQAAILSKLCQKVFGIEVIEALCEQARKNLAAANIENVTIVFGDGSLGLKEEAPFDKIIVSAASSKLPSPLLDQLVVGGMLVMPKQSSPADQMLIMIKKTSKTESTIKDILPVRFVPLINL